MKTNILKAISDETRLALLLELASFEQCACTLPSRVKRPQPLVSQHLRVLLQSGLVEVRKDGSKRLYSITSLGKRIIEDINRWRI